MYTQSKQKMDSSSSLNSAAVEGVPVKRRSLDSLARRRGAPLPMQTPASLSSTPILGVLPDIALSLPQSHSRRRQQQGREDPLHTLLSTLARLNLDTLVCPALLVRHDALFRSQNEQRACHRGYEAKAAGTTATTSNSGYCHRQVPPRKRIAGKTANEAAAAVAAAASGEREVVSQATAVAHHASSRIVSTCQIGSGGDRHSSRGLLTSPTTLPSLTHSPSPPRAVAPSRDGASLARHAVPSTQPQQSVHSSRKDRETAKKKAEGGIGDLSDVPHSRQTSSSAGPASAVAAVTASGCRHHQRKRVGRFSVAAATATTTTNTTADPCSVNAFSVVHANTAALRLLGYHTASELVGRDFQSMFRCYATVPAALSSTKRTDAPQVEGCWTPTVPVQARQGSSSGSRPRRMHGNAQTASSHNHGQNLCNHNNGNATTSSNSSSMSTNNNSGSSSTVVPLLHVSPPSMGSGKPTVDVYQSQSSKGAGTRGGDAPTLQELSSIDFLFDSGREMLMTLYGVADGMYYTSLAVSRIEDSSESNTGKKHKSDAKSCAVGDDRAFASAMTVGTSMKEVHAAMAADLSCTRDSGMTEPSSHPQDRRLTLSTTSLPTPVGGASADTLPGITPAITPVTATIVTSATANVNTNTPPTSHRDESLMLVRSRCHQRVERCSNSPLPSPASDTSIGVERLKGSLAPSPPHQQQEQQAPYLVIFLLQRSSVIGGESNGSSSSGLGGPGQSSVRGGSQGPEAGDDGSRSSSTSSSGGEVDLPNSSGSRRSVRTPDTVAGCQSGTESDVRQLAPAATLQRLAAATGVLAGETTTTVGVSGSSGTHRAKRICEHSQASRRRQRRSTLSPAEAPLSVGPPPHSAPEIALPSTSAFTTTATTAAAMTGSVHAAIHSSLSRSSPLSTFTTDPAVGKNAFANAAEAGEGHRNCAECLSAVLEVSGTHRGKRSQIVSPEPPLADSHLPIQHPPEESIEVDQENHGRDRDDASSPSDGAHVLTTAHWQSRVGARPTSSAMSARVLQAAQAAEQQQQRQQQQAAPPLPNRPHPLHSSPPLQALSSSPSAPQDPQPQRQQQQQQLPQHRRSPQHSGSRGLDPSACGSAAWTSLDTSQDGYLQPSAPARTLVEPPDNFAMSLTLFAAHSAVPGVITASSLSTRGASMDTTSATPSAPPTSCSHIPLAQSPLLVAERRSGCCSPSRHILSVPSAASIVSVPQAPNVSFAQHLQPSSSSDSHPLAAALMPPARLTSPVSSLGATPQTASWAAGMQSPATIGTDTSSTPGSTAVTATTVTGIGIGGGGRGAGGGARGSLGTLQANASSTHAAGSASFMASLSHGPGSLTGSSIAGYPSASLSTKRAHVVDAVSRERLRRQLHHLQGISRVRVSEAVPESFYLNLVALMVTLQQTMRHMRETEVRGMNAVLCFVSVRKTYLVMDVVPENVSGLETASLDDTMAAIQALRTEEARVLRAERQLGAVVNAGDRGAHHTAQMDEKDRADRHLRLIDNALHSPAVLGQPGLPPLGSNTSISGSPMVAGSSLDPVLGIVAGGSGDVEILAAGNSASPSARVSAVPPTAMVSHTHPPGNAPSSIPATTTTTAADGAAVTAATSKCPAVEWLTSGEIENVESFLPQVLIDLLTACDAVVSLRKLGDGVAAAQASFPYITQDRLNLLSGVDTVQLSKQRGLSMFGIVTANELTEEAASAASAPAPQIIPLNYERAAKRFSKAALGKSVIVQPLSDAPSSSTSERAVAFIGSPGANVEHEGGEDESCGEAKSGGGANRRADSSVTGGERGSGGSTSEGRDGRDKVPFASFRNQREECVRHPATSQHASHIIESETGETRRCSRQDAEGHCIGDDDGKERREDIDEEDELAIWKGIGESITSSGRELQSSIRSAAATTATASTSDNASLTADMAGHGTGTRWANSSWSLHQMSAAESSTSCAAPPPSEDSDFPGRGGHVPPCGTTATIITITAATGGCVEAYEEELDPLTMAASDTAGSALEGRLSALRTTSVSVVASVGASGAAGLANAAAGAGRLPAVLGDNAGPSRATIAAANEHDKRAEAHAAAGPFFQHTDVACDSDKSSSHTGAGADQAARAEAATSWFDSPSSHRPRPLNEDAAEAAAAASAPTVPPPPPPPPKGATTANAPSTVRSARVTDLFGGYQLPDSTTRALGTYSTALDSGYAGKPTGETSGGDGGSADGPCRAQARTKTTTTVPASATSGGTMLTPERATPSPASLRSSSGAGTGTSSIIRRATGAEGNHTKSDATTSDSHRRRVSIAPVAEEGHGDGNGCGLTGRAAGSSSFANRGGGSGCYRSGCATGAGSGSGGAVGCPVAEWHDCSTSGPNDSLAESRIDFFGFTGPDGFADTPIHQPHNADGRGGQEGGHVDGLAGASGTGGAHWLDPVWAMQRSPTTATASSSSPLPQLPTGATSLAGADGDEVSSGHGNGPGAAPGPSTRNQLHVLLYYPRPRDDIDVALGRFGHCVTCVTNPSKMMRYLNAGIAAVDVLVVEWCEALITPEIRHTLLERRMYELVTLFHVTTLPGITREGIIARSALVQALVNHASGDDVINFSSDIAAVFRDRTAFAHVSDSIARVRVLREMAGVRLRQPFQVVRQIGSGAFGDVFEVIMYVSKGRLAMKRVFLKNVSLRLLEQLNREVRIMSLLDHQNIITFSHSQLDGNAYAIFMELCDGTLQQRICAPQATRDWAQRDVTTLAENYPQTYASPAGAHLLQRLDRSTQAALGTANAITSSGGGGGAGSSDMMHSRADTPLPQLAPAAMAKLSGPLGSGGGTAGSVGGGLHVGSTVSSEVGGLAGSLGESPIPPHEAVLIIHDIASAIECLHDKGIIHRDIKPVNILFSNGVAKLADFGSAVKVHERRPLTNMKGTISYMAPEVVLGEPYGKPCDMWSFGCVIADIMGLPLGHLSGLHMPALTKLYRSISLGESIPVTLTHKPPTRMENHHSSTTTQRVLEAMQAASRVAHRERGEASASSPRPHTASQLQSQWQQPQQPSSPSPPSSAFNKIVACSRTDSVNGGGGGGASQMPVDFSLSANAAATMRESEGAPLLAASFSLSYSPAPLVGSGSPNVVSGVGINVAALSATGRAITCINTDSVSTFSVHTATLPRSLVELFEGLFHRDPKRRMTIAEVLEHPVSWDMEWMSTMMAAVQQVTLSMRVEACSSALSGSSARPTHLHEHNNVNHHSDGGAGAVTSNHGGGGQRRGPGGGGDGGFMSLSLSLRSSVADEEGDGGAQGERGAASVEASEAKEARMYPVATAAGTLSMDFSLQSFPAA